jgi:hypothetical protein
LLENELEFVSISWENITEYRKERKMQITSFVQGVGDLHQLRMNTINNYIAKLRQNLIFTSFYLEDKVNVIIEVRCLSFLLFKILNRN